MKQTQRMRNAVIQGLILNSVILIIFLGVGGFILLPRFIAVEGMKKDLNITATTYKNFQKKGISFTDLKQSLQSESLKNDSFSKNLVKNIDESFYNNVFSNTGSSDFISYLGELKIKLNDKKNSSDYITKDKLISQLIPVYAKNKSQDVTEVNDFDFINHVENLIYSFNIDSQGEIGVGEIQQLETKTSNTKEKEKNNLDENIYKIPLSLDVTGKKSDVANFIHYFEKVAAIEINDDSFKVYDDNFIQSSVSSSNGVTKNNIYENQVADISLIEFPEYPDSSNIKSNNDLITLMKTSQGEQRYSARININFYVAGIPSYIMQSSIVSLGESYSSLSKDILQASKKYSLQSSKFTTGDKIQALSTLNSLNQLTEELKDEVQVLQKSLSTTTDMYKVYEEAINLQTKIDKIKASYESTIAILSLNN
ncbi:hypothetical protein GW846_04770 [Candidatus Gracilibacteria bacterium]|nr:hypothetical protein [Candidatus Gracilibacteria bacterium]